MPCCAVEKARLCNVCTEWALHILDPSSTTAQCSFSVIFPRKASLCVFRNAPLPFLSQIILQTAPNSPSLPPSTLLHLSAWEGVRSWQDMTDTRNFGNPPRESLQSGVRGGGRGGDWITGVITSISQGSRGICGLTDWWWGSAFCLVWFAFPNREMKCKRSVPSSPHRGL